MQKPIRTLVSVAIATMLANTAEAGSFSLYTESSAAAIGNYAAGVAAEAADVSTGWYNPAGLSLIHQKQALAGLVVVSPTSKITGTSIFSTPRIPPYVQSFSGLDGAKIGYVPSVHVGLPLGPNTTVGFSVVAPYGLSTKWTPDSPVRYQATTSNLLTMNASPEIGSRLAEYLAIGAGIDFQFAHVRFHRVLGTPDSLAAAGASPRLLDSYSHNTGDSASVGFHAGLMFLFNEDHTRIGLNYQSQVRHRFNGNSELRGRLASLSPIVNRTTIAMANPGSIFRSDELASNNIVFPDVTTLSLYQDVNEQFALLGSVVYTGWSSLKDLELKRVAAFAPRLGQVFVNSDSNQYYHNTWRFALGANYCINDRTMLRIGGGFDKTPTNNAYRDVRIPDKDRWAASIGAHYQVIPSVGVDLGYTHIFSSGNARINRTDLIGTSQYTVNADIDAHADLFGIQAVWTLDEPAPMVMPTK